ncbi:MAG: thiamine phosphate synthase [Rhizobiales bacterium]|nr:thiamine phosphate synthase [Hyphomicrobiales bacterium]
MNDVPNRCRIVLIAPAGLPAERFATRLRQAIAGGDVASVILPAEGLDEAAYQHFCEHIVPIAQESGVAAIVAGDTRIAGRVGADGIHLDRVEPEIDMERLQARMTVGLGGAKTRDEALALGEMRPDYVFFGRFGYDNKPGPHPRNLSLGGWWAEMIEIPCIVMAGADIESVSAVCATGAEFVALSDAVFGDGVDPKAAVARANAILDEKAPRFEQ